jgi:nitroimidazol reductase NimA-like FMN-containing flavoprotein (pyridoxamine 5'-phosphate oxidase superfamily)
MGELGTLEVVAVLERQRVGRLTWLSGDRKGGVPVTYSVCDPEAACICVSVRANDVRAGGAAGERDSVRFEVDEVRGPGQWSTVVAWGVLEKGAARDGSRFRIQLRNVRGFFRGAAA